ncbi:LamG-like jellyroll fold domain-containing protein [Hymenobacter gummosus]|nr:LamG-like jellyroll fold domain-containing protein [Hymenobacter gummosus]
MEQIYSPKQPATPTGPTLRRLAGGALLTALLGSGLTASAQSALNFNGTTSYVQANNVTINGPATLEGWIKVNAFKTAFPYITSVMGVETTGNAAMIRIGDANIPAGNKVQFIMQIGGTERKIVSTATLSTNTWYHLAGTYDGTTMRLFINGVADGTLAATGTVTGTGPFSIGRNYEAVRTTNGTIDEVRVWTVARTAAEISGNSCSVSATATGLEGYWKFDEGTGTATTADATGRGHTGTLNGMTATSWTTAIPTACITTAINPRRNVAGLAVEVLGNPAQGSEADLEIRGIQNQTATVQLVNQLGAVVSEKVLTPSALTTMRSTLRLPGAAGLYVVRVSTAAGSATTKLLKQ